jgi:alcohol sulfotransferase
MFDFVAQGPRGLPEVVAYLNAWERRLAGRSALVVSYEDLRARPHAELARVTGYLGLAFEPAEIAEAVAFGDFESLKEKERTNFFRSSRLAPRDPDDPDSFKVRRAKVGGYRDYFDAEQVARLEAYVREHLAPSYGYGAGGEDAR